MASDELKQHLADRRANRATVWSMLTCLLLVVAILMLKLPLVKTGLVILVSGLLVYMATNIAGRFLVTPVVRRDRWAIVTSRILSPIVPFALATYVAGSILLLLWGLGWIWNALFG